MTIKIRSVRSLGLAVVVFVVLVCATPAGAADNGLWAVDPGGGDGPGARSNFTYTLKPEQVFRDKVTVANLSDEPLTLDLYATDAYNTSLDGGFALLEADEDPVDVGAWIELATDQLTLEPRTQADVPFRISIPLDARPGDHAGAIVAQNIEAEGEVESGDIGIDIQRRVGTRVYVRVDGPLRPDLEVTQVAVERSSALLPPFTGRGDATIAYEIKNNGNTRVTPTAAARVNGIFGETVIDFDDRVLNELLPGSRLIVIEQFTGVPPLNRLSAEVTVTGEDPGAEEPVVAKGSQTFWVVSWFVLVLLALVPVLFLLWRRERRRRSMGAQFPPPSPPSRDRELVGV